MRAITLFLDSFRVDDPLISTFSSEIDRISGDLDLDVWTRRIALPPTEARAFMDVAKRVDAKAGKLFDFAAIPAEASDPDDIRAIVEALEETKRVYTSIHGGGRELGLFADLVRETFLSLGPEACTRISFTVGGPLLTPYFPCASSVPGEIGVGGSLLYANDLRDAITSDLGIDGAIRKCYGMAQKLLLALSDKMDVRNYGLDLSPSPWMEESVANLIEAMSGVAFGRPGSHHAFGELNRAIREFASSRDVRTFGFNEAMLPYAEDSRLMELGGRGEITAYSLLSFVPVCVAGLDMVVIPYHGEDELLRFLRDAYAVLSKKPTPAGMRVVLASEEPGSTIGLGRFGRVPVMRLK